jgi:hypothetical protein
MGILLTYDFNTENELSITERLRALSPVLGPKDFNIRSEFIPVDYKRLDSAVAANHTGPYGGKIFKVAVYH